MTKKIAYLLLAYLMLHQYIYAQKNDQQQIDSLLTVLSKAKDDTTKVNLYIRLLYLHVYNKPEKGIALSKDALMLTRLLDWKPGEPRIIQAIGRLYWRMGLFNEAIVFHNKALQQYILDGNKYGQGNVLVEIGQDYLDKGELEEADTALQRALQFNEATGQLNNIETCYNILCYLYDVQGNAAAATKAAFEYLRLSEKNGNKEAIAHSAHMLASTYLALDNTKEALKYFLQGLKVSKQTGNKIEQIAFYNSLGDVYLIEKKHSESYKFYSAAVKMAEEFGDLQILAKAYLSMGNLYNTIKNYRKAISYYQYSETAYKAISSKQELAGLYADMGAVYTCLKNYVQAKKYFSRSKTLYDELKSTMAMAGYYQGKQKYDSAIGNWKSAYLNYIAYTAIRDSSLTKASLQKLVGSQIQYDNEKKEAVAKAVQEKKDVETQGEIKRQRNILYAAFGVLALVLLFSVVVYMQRNKIAKEKKRSDQLLVDKELLIREVHHRVKNNLEVVSSLLALQSAQIDDPNTKEAMQEGQNRVHSIGIVHQKLYQGETLGAIEMKDYFINLSESILDSFGADERVQITCAMHALNIDIDTAVPLGLIVNELLTNTLKYAFPDGRNGKVEIKLEKRQDGMLQLQVCDNGVGKSGVTKGTGFGGQLISLLTKQLGGTMREVIDNGTQIFFEFNVKM